MITDHLVKYIFFFCLFCMIDSLSAQIAPPGYEREKKLLQQQRSGSLFDREHIIVRDTAIIIDPETMSETIKIVVDTITMRQYLEGRLGVQNADLFLDGNPRKITDPISYEEMIIRWNRGTGKIDTLPQKD